SRARLNVSATTPCAANDASPWMSTGSATVPSWIASLPRRFVWLARARPSTTGFTASRWLGFGVSVMLTGLPAAVWYTPSAMVILHVAGAAFGRERPLHVPPALELREDRLVR